MSLLWMSMAIESAIEIGHKTKSKMSLLIKT